MFELTVPSRFHEIDWGAQKSDLSVLKLIANPLGHRLWQPTGMNSRLSLWIDLVAAIPSLAIINISVIEKLILYLSHFTILITIRVDLDCFLPRLEQKPITDLHHND